MILQWTVISSLFLCAFLRISRCFLKSALLLVLTHQSYRLCPLTFTFFIAKPPLSIEAKNRHQRRRSFVWVLRLTFNTMRQQGY